MNLETYFTQQSQKKLSDQEKFSLYQRIAEQRAQAPRSLERRRVFSRKGIYALLSGALVFLFFGSFFRNPPQVQEYRAFFAQKKDGGFQVANAAQVAEILEINGGYSIEKDGKTFQNSVIFDGDVIMLKPSAKIIFDINDHIKAEVRGPSKFTISKVDDKQYRLYLIEGDFLKLEGNEDTDALQVETEELVFETQKNTPLAIELTKTKKQTQIKNGGAPLLVKTKNENAQQNITKLESSKMLTIQDNDIAKISEIEQLAGILTHEKNLTHTLVLAQSGDAEPGKNPVALGSGALEELLTLELPEDDVLSSGAVEVIAGALDYVSPEKKVPTEQQISQISAALNGDFLLATMQAIYTAQQDEDTEKLDNELRMLSWKLISIGEQYKIKLSQGADSQSIIAMVTELEKGLEQFYLPPNKREQLAVLKNWMLFFKKPLPGLERNAFVQDLPVNLHFK